MPLLWQRQELTNMPGQGRIFKVYLQAMDKEPIMPKHGLKWLPVVPKMLKLPWMPIRQSNRFAAIRKRRPRATTPQRKVPNV